MSRPRWIRNFPAFIATAGPVGFMPIAPGTWGSALAVLIWWFGIKDLPISSYLIVLFLITAISIWSSTKAEKSLGHDSGHIVIDEFAGQLTALIVCPHSILFGVLGFFIFRLFDIWKPYPIYSSQKLPSGWGVTIDDILAGIYTAIALFFISLIITRYA